MQTGRLPTLTCTSATSCVQHLVADDWDGSATWTARVGTNAVISGTPVLAAAVNFRGRKSMLMTSGCAYVPKPSDNVDANTMRTYEIVIDDFGATGVAGHVLARRDDANTQYANWLYKNSGTSIESALYNSAGGIYLGGTAGTLASSAANKPIYVYVMVSTTLALGPRILQVMLSDGDGPLTDLTTSGSLAAGVDAGLGIGCRWHGGSDGVEGDFVGGRIMEVLRHDVLFTTSDIYERRRHFNRLKGY